MKYKSILCTILICSFSGLMSQGTEVDIRTINKIYAAQKGSYVELSNKYGDIEINTWDKDSVLIDVSIKAFSEKNDWRRTMLESIAVDFTNSSGFIIVETEWDEDASVWRKSTYNVSKGLAPNRIEVSYSVKLPKTMPLEIENRFGNVFMGDYDGDLEVEVQHGDFRARRLKNVRSLDVKYGKIKVKEITQGRLELGSGCSLDLDKGGEIMITSVSSEIEIDEVQSLNINSRHDDIFIESPQTINGSFSLSDLKIASLEHSLKANCKFGSVRVQEIAEGAESVDIVGSKTDIVIGVRPDFAGRFELDVDGEEDLSYPEDMFVVSSGLDDKKRLNVKGAMGQAAGTTVSISSSNGFVKIGE